MTRRALAIAGSSAAATLAFLACSSKPSSPGALSSEGTASGGSAGASTVVVSGGSTSLDLDASANQDGSVEPGWPADLLPPWQFDDGAGSAYKDPSLPDDVTDYFTGEPAPSGAPEFVYPLAGAMFPNNLLDVVFQWRAAGSSIFRLEVEAPDRTYRLYFACAGEECQYPIPKSEWFDLGRRYAGQELTLRLGGSAGKGLGYATTAPQKLAFSPEAVLGALYYWSAGTSELKRATFAGKAPVAFIQPNTPSSEFACVSCHSVSRDGKVIAFAVAEEEGHHGSAIRIAPTDDPENPFVRPVEGTSPWSNLAAEYDGWAVPDPNGGGGYVGPTDQLGNMVSLNADGTLAAVNGFLQKGAEQEFRMFFEIRDARSGQSLDLHDYAYLAGSAPASAVPIMPEWSPDGKSIAVTLADNSVMEGCIWSWNTCRGSIGVFSVEGGKIVGEPRVVVPYDADTGVGHFYPTWSPDGRYLAFASAAGESFDNETTLLRLVRADGGPHPCPGADCWELTAGTRYTPAEATSVKGHSTWPKFTPFAQGPEKNLFFVSFTSRLPYGFFDTGNDQLWMFAIDTARLGSGADPSYAPIWLPYQDPNDLSLTPYWTETLPCQSDPAGGCQGCVAGESCVFDTSNQCECVADVVK